MKDLQDALIPIQGHALMELRRLIIEKVDDLLSIPPTANVLTSLDRTLRQCAICRPFLPYFRLSYSTMTAMFS